MANFKISTRLLILIGLQSLLLVAIGFLGLMGFSRSNEALKTVYEDRTVPMVKLADIGLYNLRNQLAIAKSLANQVPDEIDQNNKDIKLNMAAADKLWADYLASRLTAEEAVLAKQLDTSKRTFEHEALVPVMNFLESDHYMEARDLGDQKLGQLSMPVTKKLDELLALQVAGSRAEYQSAVSRFQVIRLVSILSIVIGLGTSAGLGLIMIRGISLSLKRASDVMTDIATNQDFSRRVPVDRMDEIGLSIVAFNTMIGKIQESSQQLKQKTADIQAMLHYIPQGILTVMAGNKVHPEFSTHLEAILQTQDIAGRDLMELVFAGSNLNADTLSQIETVVSASIGEDSMNFEFNRHLLVSEVERTLPDASVQILDLSWSPITDEHDQVVRLMLCVRDVTEVKALAAKAGQQKRELDIIGQILAISQEKFFEFVDGATQFLAENKQIITEAGAAGTKPPLDVVTQLFRNMHTIKGNARTYGFLHLTNIVHEAEQSYDALRQDPEAVWDTEKLLGELATASSAVEEYAHINKVKLGRTGPGRRSGFEKYLMVQKQDIQEAIDLLEDSLRGNDLAAMRLALQRAQHKLQMLGTVGMCEVLEGIVDSLPSLAQELGKEPPHIAIEDHGIVLHTQIAGLLKNVFMHLYRNSMDHGIENAAQRVAKGKAPAGRIALELRLTEGRLWLTLRDDGRGLAVQRIGQKALQNGLITPQQQLTAQETAQLIFLPGFSTAEQVTEVSGRGVGMDAVKSFLEREEGTIALRLLGAEVDADGYCAFETVLSLPSKVAVQGLASPTGC